MVGILLSYWGGLFSGAMLVSGRVRALEGYLISSEAHSNSLQYTAESQHGNPEMKVWIR